jgi:cytochrome c peroxidase
LRVRVVCSKTLLSAKQGRFPSDTALIQDPEMLKWVEAYAADQDLFFKDFARVFIKMGTLGINTGK